MTEFRTQRGMTLIEIMVAMTIGLLILLGMANLFVQTKQSFRQDEIISRMQEDSRFALDVMRDDISMGGFWGLYLDGSLISNDGSIDPTTDTEFANYASGIWGLDNISSVQSFDWTSSLDDLQLNTDAISIRRVAGASSTSLPADGYFLETNGTVAKMLPGTNASGAATVTPATYWEYTPAIYYVRTYCRSGDGIPSLVKRYFDASTWSVETDCIAQGIEDMQIEYGLDADGDGYPDQYVNGASLTDSSNIAAVRVFLLARAAKEDTNYTNSKSYSISNSPNTSAKNDRYYRRVYSTTIQTRNVTNQRVL